MAQQVINNNDSGLTVRTGLNDMFAELYASVPIPFIFLNQTTSFAQGIPAKSWIDKILITGSGTFKIGTSSGASDIIASSTITDYMKLQILDYSLAGITYYITITSGSLNFRIDTYPTGI